MRNKIILLTAVLGLCFNDVFGTESFDIDFYTYTILDAEAKTVSVGHNSKVNANIDIPSTVNYNEVDYTVTEVAASGFASCMNLKSVILPSTITEIKNAAFSGCTALQSITMHGNVDRISRYAFSGAPLLYILYEGINVPEMSVGLYNVPKETLILQVLSTAAKHSFDNNANWAASVSSVDVVPVEISEATDNSSTLEYHTGHTADVELTRTIKAGGYNTLCLPFAVSAEQVTDVFGSGCDIQELTSATVSASGIDLQFTQRTAMDAGKPYLVKPLSEVSNPTFTSVVLTDETTPSETANVDFIGIFSPTEMMASDNTLIMGSGSTLHPTASETMNGFRGYFTLKTVGAKTAAKKQINLIYSTTETPTDIAQYPTANDQRPTTNSQKLLINGQLLILRDGIYYNALGTKVK